MNTFRKIGVFTFFSLMILLISGTARAQTVVIASDGFENGWNGGVGWIGSWQQFGPASLSGEFPFAGQSSAKLSYINGKGGAVWRQINVAGLSNATLKFWSAHNSGSERVYIVVQIIGNIGSTPWVLDTFRFGGPSGTYQERTIDLTKYLAGRSSLTVFFQAYVNNDTAAFLDDVSVESGTPPPGLAPTGSPLPEPTWTPVSTVVPPTALPVATPTHHPEPSAIPLPTATLVEATVPPPTALPPTATLVVLSPTAVRVGCKTILSGRITETRTFRASESPICLGADTEIAFDWLLHFSDRPVAAGGQAAVELYLCGFNLHVDGYALFAHVRIKSGCP